MTPATRGACAGVAGGVLMSQLPPLEQRAWDRQPSSRTIIVVADAIGIVVAGVGAGGASERPAAGR